MDTKRCWKKNVMLFLAGQTISLFGSSLVQFAITWYITLNTQSGMMLTISIICGFLPTLFLSPFAGVWADRHNRKMLIIVSDALIALATLVLAVLFFIGYDKLWLLFVVSVIRSLGSSIQTPAVNAFIPQFVPDDKLVKVNAVNGTIQSMAMLLSPMLSGALLSVASIEVVFFVDVITAAFAIITLLLFVHVPPHERATARKPKGYFQDLGEGLKFVINYRFIRDCFIYCAVIFIFVSPVAFLTPLQVTRSFGPEVWRLTFAEVALAGGMILGGLIMTAWGGLKNKIYTIGFSILIFGIATIGLGLVNVFWLYLVFAMIAGLVIPAFNTTAIALLQQKVETDYQGRVFSVFNMIQSVMVPLSILIFGPLADVIAIEFLLIVTGLVMAIMSGVITNSKVLVEGGKTISET